MNNKEEIELGIDPKPINETEERQLSLLLNLIRNRQGLSFVQLRQIMKEYYSNSNLESDQKKLQRDIDELKENGFSIKFHKVSHESMEYNVYRMDDSQRDARIQMTEEELRKFSFLVLKKSEEIASNELFTASQKIFSRDLQHFPSIKKKSSNENTVNEEEISEISENLYKIMTAIKNKTPLKIEYFKTNPKESHQREILKISEMSGEFLFNGKINENDLNYHALNFNIHEAESLEITCSPENSWKLEKFLYPHPFRKVGNTFLLTTTNRSALFSFILKENDCIESVNSDLFIKELHEFLSKIKNNYTNSPAL